MMRKAIFLLAALGLALAASFPEQVPKGAAFAIYLDNIGAKKELLKEFRAELKRQGLSIKDLIELFGANEEEAAYFDLLRLETVGQEGLVAIYPDGSGLILARPSPEFKEEFFAKLKELLKNAKPKYGFMVEEYSDAEGGLAIGYNDEIAFLVFAFTEDPIAMRFFTKEGELGLDFALKGDVSLFYDLNTLKPLLEGELPLEVTASLLAFARYDQSWRLDQKGIESASVLTPAPEASESAKKLVLPECQAWPLNEFPQVDSISSLCLDPGALSALIKELGGAFGYPLELDLTPFGPRLAVASLAVPLENPALAMQKPFGDTLIYLESQDPEAASAYLLELFKSLAGASTPEGQGGFELKPYKVGAFEGKEVSLGLGQPVYLFTEKDRVILATSKEAANALENPPLKELPQFAKYQSFYPAKAVLYNWGQASRLYQVLADQLVATTPLVATSPEELELSMEIAKRTAAYVKFLGQKIGTGASYSVVEGGSRKARGVVEVSW